MYHLTSAHQKRSGKTCVTELGLDQRYTWADLKTSFTENWSGYPKDAILLLLRRGQWKVQLQLLMMILNITHPYYTTGTSRTYLCSKKLCEHLCSWVGPLQSCTYP